MSNYCSNCGKSVNRFQDVCTNCGFAIARRPRKNKNTAGILALLIGTLGIHWFYLGKSGLGAFHLIMFIVFIWWLPFLPLIIATIEAFYLFLMSEETFNFKYLSDY